MKYTKRKKNYSHYFAPLVVAAILSAYSFVLPNRIFSGSLISEASVHSVVTEIMSSTIILPSISGPKSFYERKKSLFDSLQLESVGLSRMVFEIALRGMEKLKNSKLVQTNILSIADFSKSSTERRLFVIDLENEELLFNTWVAHGRNSGEEAWANSFSNKPHSKKSSLGFYVTGSVYNGNNGYSLKLEGMEKGFNSNAFQRAIVIHGADYVNTDYINSQGYIGRSEGCPAVAPKVCRPLINTIKEGSCLFIYYPSPVYLKKSALCK